MSDKIYLSQPFAKKILELLKECYYRHALLGTSVCGAVMDYFAMSFDAKNII